MTFQESYGVFCVIRWLLCTCYVFTVRLLGSCCGVLSDLLHCNIVTKVFLCCCVVTLWLLGCSAWLPGGCGGVVGGCCIVINRFLWCFGQLPHSKIVTGCCPIVVRMLLSGYCMVTRVFDMVARRLLWCCGWLLCCR